MPSRPSRSTRPDLPLPPYFLHEPERLPNPELHRDEYLVVEVGGGGRYDRLVGHFVTDRHITAVPATGWAFGVERLVDVLDQLELLGDNSSATTTVSLGKASADLLVVPGPDATGYVDASRVAAEHRDCGRCVDVYVGDRACWRRYASARGIAEYELLAPNED